MSELAAPDVLIYKYVNDRPLHLDIYPPSPSSGSRPSAKVPAVIYFHGGALTVGNRKSWFPEWLHRRVVLSGIAFISADYQLIPPATGHDILSDILDLFRFLQHEANARIRELRSREEDVESQSGQAEPASYEIDTNALAVAGSSAGGLCAYLAATHAIPPPRAVLSLYGMGGDMLTWQYLAPKTTPFFRGREILDPADFAAFLHPACHDLPPTSDSPLVYYPATYHIPGYPANPRMLLGRLYLQLGTFLDYLVGSHKPSISATLRELLAAEGEQSQSPDSDSWSQHLDDIDKPKLLEIPAEHRRLFPQFNVTSAFPPTFLIHGSRDTAVLVRESQKLSALLQSAGVRVELQVVDGKEHSFDYEPTAEGEFSGPGGLFDRAAEFIKQSLFM